MSFRPGSINRQKWVEKRDANTLDRIDFVTSLKGSDLDKYKQFKRNNPQLANRLKFTSRFISSLSDAAKGRARDVKYSLEHQKEVRHIKRNIAEGRQS